MAAEGGKGANTGSWLLMFLSTSRLSHGWGEFEISYLLAVCGLPRLSWSDLGTFRADSYGQTAIHCFYLNLHLAQCSPLSVCLCAQCEHTQRARTTKLWWVWQRVVCCLHWVISQLYLGYEGVGPKTIITQLTNSRYLYHTCIVLPPGVSAAFRALAWWTFNASFWLI